VLLDACLAAGIGGMVHPEGLEDVVTDVTHAELNKALLLFDVGTRDLYNATELLRKQ
jgi:hypothetical protein